MILDYYDDINLSPEMWEELCDNCYSVRYTGLWHKVPSAYCGDCGIEGYVENGIVYQCYFPEQKYANDALYEHQRDKLTKDTNKLIDLQYGEKLKKVLNGTIIKEWHFVVPEYKDRRILEHACVKQKEIQEKIKKDIKSYSYIDSDVKIKVMQANSYIEEVAKVIRAQNSKIKLRIDVPDVCLGDCDVVKVDNIKRKIRAISPNMNQQAFDKLVNSFLDMYLKGVAMLNKLRVEMPSIFNDLYDLINAYKNEVEIKTSLILDSADNNKVFQEIMKDFENELNKLGIFDGSTVLNLKNEIISSWLADCSLEFVL